MQLHESTPIPAGMIATPAGRVMIDSGYARLLQALDEAYEINDHVVVSRAGDHAKVWQFFTGDHVQRDGSLDLGEGVVVLPDSTTPDNGLVNWRGGHTAGDRRLERFTIDGVAMTVQWTHPQPQA